MFDLAQAPEGDRWREGEDGPAACRGRRAAGADFAADEAEEGGSEEGEEEEAKIRGSKMKTMEAAYQRGLKGKKGRTP